jgi:hypothetical protein
LNVGSLTVRKSTFAGNFSHSSALAGPGDGGGIGNFGILTVRRSQFYDNVASTEGGGIFNGGTLFMLNSTLSHNEASRGGGVFDDGILLSTKGSLITLNSADQDGGGIFLANGTQVAIERTTVINNTPNDIAPPQPETETGSDHDRRRYSRQ